jgi:hypothetical protein
MNSWKSVYPLKNKKQVNVPGWFGKEIKNEMSEESKRIYEELTRNSK